MSAECQVLGVIPARFASSRFPGKPLALILGKSLLQRTYENALKAKRLNKLIIATDTEQIASHVRSFGGEVVLTSPTCACGTDRVAEAVEQHFPNFSYVVNVQGDEPCINPQAIDDVVGELIDKGCAIMTAVTPLTDLSLVASPSVVKCVFNKEGQALYFSRSPIPYPQKGPGYYYRHLGIYAFKKEALLTFVRLPATANQQIEDLEQLKALEHGLPLFVKKVQDLGIGVDRPEDIEKVEQML